MPWPSPANAATPMKHFMRSTVLRPALVTTVLIVAGLTMESLPGQSATTPGSGAAPEPLNWTTQQDHQNMKEQLGITRLRPGPSGRAGATNAANYDPAKDNPFPNLPEPLTLKNGQ